MFDWNDQELVDIIWGEARESDDHIVPYPNGSDGKPLVTLGDHSKKQWNQEARTINPAEQKTSGTKNDLPIPKLESCSHIDKNEGLSTPEFGMDPWADMPLPSSACSNGYTGKNCLDSMGTEVSDDFTEMTNFGSARANTTQLDNDAELFGNEHEDKERGGLLDYGWENIGSFDDLDRIFRNDDPIFGRESIANADEVWSPSTNIISSPAKSFPLAACLPTPGLGALRNTSDQYEIKMEFVPCEEHSVTPGSGRMSDPNSHDLQNVLSNRDEIAGKGCCSSVGPVVECHGEKSNFLLNKKTASEMMRNTSRLSSLGSSESSATQNNFADKVSSQKKLSKFRKTAEENGKDKLSKELCSTWSPTENQFEQFGNQLAISAIQTFPSSTLSPKGQLGGPESFKYLHTSHPYLRAGYGNPTHHYPVMPLLSHVHSDKLQSDLSGFEFSSGPSKHEDHLDKSPDAHTKFLTMTPQEKIEKLRRRQQMQAILAIQKQQQQFSHQVMGHSVTQTRAKENRSQDTAETNHEVEDNTKILPTLDPSTPLTQGDSNVISMVVDECPLEETILDQLQDVVGKLDIRIRLCIRDSLFRLAQSSMQRHNASDTSSANKSSWNENEVTAKEETNRCGRSTIMPGVETETNSIDRTMAHLLFCKPLESSARFVNDGEIPVTPVSNKLPCEPKRECFINLPMGCVSENSTDMQHISHQ